MVIVHAMKIWSIFCLSFLSLFFFSSLTCNRDTDYISTKGEFSNVSAMKNVRIKGKEEKKKEKKDTIRVNSEEIEVEKKWKQDPSCDFVSCLEDSKIVYNKHIIIITNSDDHCDVFAATRGYARYIVYLRMRCLYK